jgi:hypothetical protein
MKKILLVLGLVLGLASISYALPLIGTKLSWTDPTTTVDGLPINADTAITGHTIYCGTTSGTYTITKTVGLVTQELVSDIPLISGKTYFCVVTASNKYGEGGLSVEKTFTIDGSVPSAPTNLTVQ